MPSDKGRDTILGMQMPHSPARRRPESSGPGRVRLSRARLSPAERWAIQVAAVDGARLRIYRVRTGSPSTPGYVSPRIVLGGPIGWVRRAPLPGRPPAGLA